MANKLRVVSLSILQGNHYATSLFASLRSLGVELRDYHPSKAFLPLVLKHRNLDILHLHTIHFFVEGTNEVKRWLKFSLFTVQLFLIKLTGTKIVWTVHEWSDKFEGKWGKIHPLWAWILGRIFDRVIVHAKSTQDVVEQALHLKSSTKIQVIPHGNYIDSYPNEVSKAEARTLLSIPEDCVMFLFFGNIFRAKGCLDAIDSFKSLANGNAHLMIVGSPGEEDIEDLINSKICSETNIEFIAKKIPDGEVQKYFNASDCVVLPYKIFTTSGVVILAMSFAKACIAPRLGYFSEVLDDEGAFLYDPATLDGLSVAFEQALFHKEDLEQMGKHNSLKCSEWDWCNIAKRTLESYRSIL